MALLNDLINLNLSETTDKIIAEYIWYSFLYMYTLNTSDYKSYLTFFVLFVDFFCRIGGSGMDMRSKARVGFLLPEFFSLL